MNQKNFYFPIDEYRDSKQLFKAIRRVNPNTRWNSGCELEQLSDYVEVLRNKTGYNIILDNKGNSVTYSDKSKWLTDITKYNPVADKLDII